MDYKPDKWMIVKLEHDKGFHHRVFATWGGGYLHGDSWKLNSGITGVREDENYYYFDGSSGSVYQCHKKMYGSTGYGYGVISHIKDTAQDVTVTILENEHDWMNYKYDSE